MTRRLMGKIVASIEIVLSMQEAVGRCLGEIGIEGKISWIYLLAEWKRLKIGKM